jgi:hypothetical protein
MDEFLRARFDGADGIRGLYYQLLYSIPAALDLRDGDDGCFSARQGRPHISPGMRELSVLYAPG